MVLLWASVKRDGATEVVSVPAFVAAFRLVSILRW